MTNASLKFSSLETTLDVICSSNYENYIESCNPNVHEYQNIFSITAQKIRKLGDINTANALDLLSLVCSSTLRPNNAKDPFSQFPVGENLAVPRAFTNKQGQMFAKLATIVQAPELSARLADLAWIILKDQESAKIAISKYLITSELQYYKSNQNLSHERIARIERALRLSLMVKNKESTHTIINLLLTMIDQKNSNFDLASGYSICRILSSLPNIFIDPKEIAQHSINIAGMMPSDYVGLEKRRRLFQISKRCFTKCQQKKFAKYADLEASNALIQIGELHEKSGQDIIAASFYEEAIVELKLQGDQKIKIGDLQRKQMLLNKNILDKMQHIPIDYEVDSLIKEPIPAMKGQSLSESLKQFAFLCPALSKEELEKQVIQSNKDCFMSYGINRVLVGDDGRYVFSIPPLNVIKDGELELSLKANICMKAKDYHLITITNIIKPAQQELLKNFEINEPILQIFLKNSTLFPRGRERLWLKGLQAGFDGDFIVALSILIPQFEFALLHHLDSQNQIVIKNKSIYEQENKTLNYLFDNLEEKITEFLGENLYFELRCLLVEKSGCNFRNEFAHGLMSEQDFNQPSAIYLWWLFFKITVIFCQN